MAYQQLLDVLREQAQYRRQYVETPPVACPDDGVLLDTNPEGVLHCPMGHYVTQVAGQWVTRATPV